MKLLIKRYIFLTTVIVMIFSTTSCKNNSKIKLLDEPDTQPVYLSFFSQQKKYAGNVAKYWCDRFTEKYNKKVYINFDGASYYADEGLSYRELLEKRLESNSPDDLYIINAEDVLEFEKKGYWMDLSDMDFVSNLSESALYQSTYNGKIFSVPLSFTGFGFVWNVDMLTERNLTIPQNLEEFLDICEKLKNDDILPYGANKGFALTVPAMCVGLSDLYGSEERDDKIEALNSAEAPISSYLRKGLNFLSMMIEKGYLDPQQALESTPREEDIKLFLDGKCAFICAGLGDFDNLTKKMFQIEMTGLPVLPNGCIAVYGGNSRLCVNPNSKNLDTVREFIEMVGTPEALMESAELDHAMSSAKVGGNVEPTAKGKMIELLRQPGQIPNQDFALHFNTWESIRDASRELCEGTDIDRVCDMLDQKQQTELKVYCGK